MKIESQNPFPPPAATEKSQENEEIRKVARGFEAVFVNQLVGAMRKTVVKGGLIPESNAERTYQAMLDQEYAQRMSETGQLGIAQMVYDHLLRQIHGQ